MSRAATVFEAITQAPASAGGVPTGEHYTVLRTLTQPKVTAPSKSGLNPGTNELEIGVRVALNQWNTSQHQTLFAKWGVVGQSCYILRVINGYLEFTYSTNGTNSATITSTAALPYADGDMGDVWVTFNPSSGGNKVCTFQYEDNTGWHTLGSVITTAGTTSIFAGTSPMSIGAWNNGTSNIALGDFLYVDVYNAGVLVLSVDFTSKLVGQTEFYALNTILFTIASGAELVDGGDAGWRIAVQLLVPSGAARVGLAKVGQARVSTYEWLDITPWVVGLEWRRGAGVSNGWPHYDVGVLNMTLGNEEHRFSQWRNEGLWTPEGNILDTSLINREWGPGAIVRVVTFQPGASTDVYYGASSTISVVTHEWEPLFTGRVETWDDEVGYNDADTVSVTVVETIADLAAIDAEGISPIGAGETALPRLARLLSGVWEFGGVEDQWLTADDIGTLQATAMANNRLGEIHLTCDSTGVAIRAHRGGWLVLGGPQDLDGYDPPSTGTFVVRFTNSLSAPPLSDSTWFGASQDAYYNAPVTISSGTDRIQNDVTLARVGGTAQNYSVNESISAYGRQSYRRNDLICQSDATCLELATRQAQWQSCMGTNVLPYYADFEQTLTPSEVTICDQHDVQRYLDPGQLSLLDVYDDSDPETPAVRFVGNIHLIKHNIVRTIDGIVWTTSISILPRVVYKP